MSELTPGARAALDRSLAEATDALIGQAARRDHLDVVEANTDLTLWFSAHMTHSQLAASAAALAIRLRRGGEVR
jgi:hypothetical protein